MKRMPVAVLLLWLLYALGALALLLVVAGPRQWVRLRVSSIRERHVALRSLQTAIYRFESEHDRLPDAGSCEDLRRLLVPIHSEPFECQIAGGGQIQYRFLEGERGARFMVISTGADNALAPSTNEWIRSALRSPEAFDQAAQPWRTQIADQRPWDVHINGDLILIDSTFIPTVPQLDWRHEVVPWPVRLYFLVIGGVGALVFFALAMLLQRRHASQEVQP